MTGNKSSLGTTVLNKKINPLSAIYWVSMYVY